MFFKWSHIATGQYYELLVRQAFLQTGLVALTMKSNFSTERCGALSKQLLAVLLFNEKPFRWFWLIVGFFSLPERMILP